MFLAWNGFPGVIWYGGTIGTDDSSAPEFVGLKDTAVLTEA
jgi:hypothetical protein